MRSAQAHAVARIGRVAAVSAFPDVVSEQAMLRRRLAAAPPILDPLATEASTLEDSNAKLSVSCRMVERIGTFRLRPNGTAVTFRHEGVKHRDARHDHCQSETVGGGLGLAFRDCRSERVARRSVTSVALTRPIASQPRQSGCRSQADRRVVPFCAIAANSRRYAPSVTLCIRARGWPSDRTGIRLGFAA